MQGGGFGDVAFTGSELFLLAALLGPLISAIVWLTKRILDGKDQQIAELQELLRMNTKTTERSVEVAGRSINIDEDQFADLLSRLDKKSKRE